MNPIRGIWGLLLVILGSEKCRISKTLVLVHRVFLADNLVQKRFAIRSKVDKKKYLKQHTHNFGHTQV